MTKIHNIVDSLHSEFQDLINYLDSNAQPSLRILVEKNFRKSLLLAAASFFEKELTTMVYNYIVQCTHEKHVIPIMVYRNVIERKYHTWFNWTATNANQFFSLFGEDFNREAKLYVNEHAELKDSIQKFMELGASRNMLVHQDFASFSLDKTSDEIYSDFGKALNFLSWFPQFLNDFTAKLAKEVEENQKEV